MSLEGMGCARPTTFRARRSSRALVALTLITTVLLLAVDSLRATGSADAIADLAVFAPPFVAMWWLCAVKPRLSVFEHELVIRNPLATRTVAMNDLTGVEAGYGGLVLTLRGGDQIRVWAVQKSNVANWLGRRVRADEVADLLRKKAQLL